MCGIAGFSNIDYHYTKEKRKWTKILRQMNQKIKNRGPSGDGIYLNDGCGLAHTRLAVIDLDTGKQPMTRYEFGNTCHIVFNGEIYNMSALKESLKANGAAFNTKSDTEVLLAGYMREGIDFIKKVNGIFAFALWDERKKSLYLCRDRLGIKPLFYTVQNQTLVFSSLIRGIFAYEGITPVISREGFCEIFGLGPARTPGNGVYKGISEVLPGHYFLWNQEGGKQIPYWQLTCKEHTDTFEETVEKTAYLINDAVKMQMLSDIPICTFLSGGVDSSLVTAICAQELAKRGEKLKTFSFDFEENHRYFQSNHFQPEEDRPYVEKMIRFSKTEHSFLECTNEDLFKFLFYAVDACDLPCMADVESSLLYFCKQVARQRRVVLTGECADEIFGGYPWFHQKKMFMSDSFPWTPDLKPREEFLNPEFAKYLQMQVYVQDKYEKSIQETPKFEEDSEEERRRREISYLNLRWFMATLLNRMDRTSMHYGLEARVPLADHRIVEYVWNVPWKMKCPNGMVKGLLRRAGSHFLPEEILYRKKSPYPKTYHPMYEKMLGEAMLQIIKDPAQPIYYLIDVAKMEKFIKSPKDYGKPWYGQLMAGPQLIAYYLQINDWLKKYHVQQKLH